MNLGDRGLMRTLGFLGLIAGGTGVWIGIQFVGLLLPFAQGRPNGEEYLPLLFSAACLLMAIAGLVFLLASPEVWNWALVCHGGAVLLGVLYAVIMAIKLGDYFLLMFFFGANNFIYFGLPPWIVLYSVVAGIVFWVKRPRPDDLLPGEKPLKQE